MAVGEASTAVICLALKKETDNSSVFCLFVVVVFVVVVFLGGGEGVTAKRTLISASVVIWPVRE